jgi:hypothetical protein
MIRTTFYYKKNNVNFIFAVKNCKRPAQTKVYKNLVKLLDNDKVEAIGYSNETID